MTYRYERLQLLTRGQRFRREAELLASESRTWGVVTLAQALLAAGFIALGLWHSAGWFVCSWFAVLGASATGARWTFCRRLRRGYGQQLRELRREGRR